MPTRFSGYPVVLMQGIMWLAMEQCLTKENKDKSTKDALLSRPHSQILLLHWTADVWQTPGVSQTPKQTQIHKHKYHVTVQKCWRTWSDVNSISSEVCMCCVCTMQPHLSLLLGSFEEQSIDDSNSVSLDVLISPGIKKEKEKKRKKKTLRNWKMKHHFNAFKNKSG